MFLLYENIATKEEKIYFETKPKSIQMILKTVRAGIQVL